MNNDLQSRQNVIKGIFIIVIIILLSKIFYIQIINSQYKKSAKNQINARKLMLERIVNDQQSKNIEIPNLAIQIFFAKSNLLKFENIDLENIKRTKFLNLSAQAKEQRGLARYSINLVALSILLSTLLSLILIFVRIEKKD